MKKTKGEMCFSQPRSHLAQRTLNLEQALFQRLLFFSLWSQLPENYGLYKISLFVEPPLIQRWYILEKLPVDFSLNFLLSGFLMPRTIYGSLKLHIDCHPLIYLIKKIPFFSDKETQSVIIWTPEWTVKANTLLMVVINIQDEN